MTSTEFTVNVPDFGDVDVVRQDDDDTYWDLFDSDGECLNYGQPFWTLPTESQVIDYINSTKEI